MVASRETVHDILIVLHKHLKDDQINAILSDLQIMVNGSASVKDTLAQLYAAYITHRKKKDDKTIQTRK